MRVEDDAHFKVCFGNPKSMDLIIANIEAKCSWAELGAPNNDLRGYVLVEGNEGAVTGFVEEINDFDCLMLSGMDTARS